MASSLNMLSPNFKEDLLGCLFGGDIPGCLLTCICPCITASLGRTKVDGRFDQWGWCDCLCGSSPYAVRQQIRKNNGYAEDRIMDCLGACLCGPCYIYQNAKEAGVTVIMPPNMGRL
eukprot:m.40619 g.40619  ORF g.40619 m.40619 type:complete len:117 (+) comp14132_c1_seq1:304-654(+)